MFQQIKLLAAATVGAAVLASSPVAPAAPVVPAAPHPSCQIDPQCDAFRPVYFQDYVPGTGQTRGIYRMNPDGTGRTEVIPDASAPSVDRARAQIAFVRAGAVWIAKADGSDQRQVTERGINTSDVSLSPDGDYIAYSHGPDSRIAVHRLGDSDRCSGFSDSEGGPLRGVAPKWAPDGVHLAYTLTGDVRGVGTAHCKGTDRRVLIVGTSGYVDWSDDGKRVSYDAGSSMAWVDVQTPGVGHPVPNTFAIAGGASWSPDGQQLVITHTAFENRGIWTVRLDGSEAVKITEIADHSGRPDWGYPAAPVVGTP